LRLLQVRAGHHCLQVSALKHRGLTVSSVSEFDSEMRLEDVKNVAATLSRLPNGRELVNLAARSGLWTTELHALQFTRPPFVNNLGNLTPPELSNTFAAWTSEFGRICELMGHLSAHREALKVQAKSARASARAHIRREFAAISEGKAPTSAAVTDAAEEDPSVLEADKALNGVEMIIAIVGATKESTQAYLGTISREIAFRETQVKSRM
jgi:hypothetical protein